MLLHGHLDSWHIGVGDNLTGDATMLEVARVLGSTGRAETIDSIRLVARPLHRTVRRFDLVRR